ncbi:flagellar assembly peptidoglycan hydrolase FlgJ [Pandoraea apista]|uniref:Peptidoglycan hydrolase FlgJ n=1 Tax=Pandoraea apista TaxID=93218 RepID=A0A0B5FMA5_9BURK|nr:flagellar assembly peptidoglycan hydrolase FlgJ [Pandoraea apista]AJF00849.2 flagellar rod assembly protein FlgJ [Pandoraea apista]AKH72199.1 flagellar rod assembly protein FlgJ [Pandoraea apista]AKI60630.1 flagellar rod assembly protein FlgJ [Pandoraea apista]ALS66324.1 flagellar rod assembly protein/muramidase FlgJ [Pandoraea apista]AVF38784.1 flagellar assembly peptidoglycan hydrolase FlgJ [Pandoraea apista]
MADGNRLTGAAGKNLPDLTQRATYDMQGLTALRAAAHQQTPQATQQAAKQFEAVFTQMMMKSMREATMSGGLLGSDQEKMFNGMLDDQLAQQLASHKGIGLADLMLKQLANTGTTLPPAAVGRQQSLQGRAFNTADAIGVADGAPAAAGEFVDRMATAAQNASAQSGIPARFMLSQAALESGWGKREIRRSDGSTSFNVFGIKAGKNWTGPTVEVATTEYVNGQPRKVMAKFRAYRSYDEAFNDYANLISNNPRYASVVASANDAASFATNLQRAGYATDPQYASKLMKIMKHFA